MAEEDKASHTLLASDLSRQDCGRSFLSSGQGVSKKFTDNDVLGSIDDVVNGYDGLTSWS